MIFIVCGISLFLGLNCFGLFIYCCSESKEMDDIFDNIAFYLFIILCVIVVIFFFFNLEYYTKNPKYWTEHKQQTYCEKHNIDISELKLDYPAKDKKGFKTGYKICIYGIVIEGIGICIYLEVKRLKNLKKIRLNKKLEKLDEKISELETNQYNLSSENQQKLDDIIKLLIQTREEITNQICLLDAEDGIKIAKEIQATSSAINIQRDIDELDALIKLNRKDN